MFDMIGVLKRFADFKKNNCDGVSFLNLALQLLHRYSPNNLSVWSTEHNNCIVKSQRKVLHTDSAAICFEELIYKIVTSAVFTDTHMNSINTCKDWHALWF